MTQIITAIQDSHLSMLLVEDTMYHKQSTNNVFTEAHQGLVAFVSSPTQQLVYDYFSSDDIDADAEKIHVDIQYQLLQLLTLSEENEVQFCQLQEKHNTAIPVYDALSKLVKFNEQTDIVRRTAGLAVKLLQQISGSSITACAWLAKQDISPFQTAFDHQESQTGVMMIVGNIVTAAQSSVIPDGFMVRLLSTKCSALPFLIQNIGIAFPLSPALLNYATQCAAWANNTAFTDDQKMRALKQLSFLFKKFDPDLVEQMKLFYLELNRIMFQDVSLTLIRNLLQHDADITGLTQFVKPTHQQLELLIVLTENGIGFEQTAASLLTCPLTTITEVQLFMRAARDLEPQDLELKGRLQKQFAKAMRRYSKQRVDEDLIAAVLGYAVIYGGGGAINDVLGVMEDSQVPGAREAAVLLREL